MKNIPIYLVALMLCCCKPAIGQPLHLYFQDTTYTDPNADLVLDLKVNHCPNIGALQFTVTWDDAVLILQNNQSVALNFTPNTSGNNLMAAWADLSGTGLSLPDSSTLLRLFFKSANQQPLTGTVRLVNAPLSIEAFEVINGIPSPLETVQHPGTVVVRTCATAIDLGTPSYLCPDTSWVLLPNCTDCQSITWQDGSTGNTFAVDTAQWVIAHAKGPFDCMAVDSVAILPGSRPEIELPPTHIQCGVSPVTLLPVSATAVSFLWSNGLSGVPVTTDQPNTYTVTVTNAEGCSAAASTTLVQHLAPTVTWEAKQPDCAQPTGSLSIHLSGGNFGPYLWAIGEGMDGQPAPQFDGLTAGNYPFFAQDNAGCTFVLDTVTINPAWVPGIAILAEQLPFSLGEVMGLEAVLPPDFPESQIESILWSPAETLTFSGNGTTAQLSPQAQPATTTLFTVTLTTVDGCTVQDSVLLVLLEPIPEAIFVPNVFSPLSGDYNSRFTLFAHEGYLERIEALTIFDRWGSTVFQQQNLLPNDIGAGWDGTVQGRRSEAGVYLWTATVLTHDGQLKQLAGSITLIF